MINYGIVKRQMLQMLYNPGVRAWDFARAVLALEAGDAGPMWEGSFASGIPKLLECECSTSEVKPSDGAFVSTAISCSDGEPVRDELEELQTFYDNFLTKSSFADVWTGRVECA